MDAEAGQRVGLAAKVGDETEVLLCSLREGGQESANLDIVLDRYTEFAVHGAASVHLAGYYMPMYEDEGAPYPGCSPFRLCARGPSCVKTECTVSVSVAAAESCRMHASTDYLACRRRLQAMACHRRADGGSLVACVEPESVCRAEGDDEDEDEDEEDEEEVEDFAALAPHGLSPSDFYTLVHRPACDTWLACFP